MPALWQAEGRGVIRRPGVFAAGMLLMTNGSALAWDGHAPWEPRLVAFWLAVIGCFMVWRSIEAKEE